MKKFTNLFRWKRFHLIISILAAFAGIFIFQAQDISNPGDDLDHRFDRPTREYFSHYMPPPNLTPDVITDAFGYDNFDIGFDQAEQNLMVNPRDPWQMFFGVNGAAITAQWRHTEDGYTWTGPNNPAGGNSGDPWAAYDSMYNCYAQVLGGGNPVFRSTNNGLTWGSGVPSAPGGDRNTMAADYTGGPFAGYLYAGAWSPNCNFARSTNLGASWTTTFTTSNTTPGNMICIGPSPNGVVQGGSVYFVSVTGGNPVPSTYNFFRSTDGGATMVTMSTSAISPGYVGTLNGASRLVINNARTRPYPMIACDNSYGPYRGRLYCVYASNVPAGNANKPDIKCQYSTDGGATWSSEVIVNDNSSPELSDQWFPAVWVDKVNGRLYVKWYDTRNNPATYGVDVYASYSTTGGTSFVTNQKLTTANWVYPCPACGANQNCYRGDYDAINSYKFSAFAVWWDARNCNYQNMGAYFPDFAMKVSTSAMALNGQNDSGFAFVSVPSVKLFSDKAHFTSTVTPTPGSGTITVSFLNRTNSTLQDTLNAYPDSIRVRIRTSGGVTPGTYTVTITGVGRIGGTDGPPIHKRIIMLTTFTGIKPLSNEIPDKFYLYQNFPNPFNPNTNIRFDLAKGGYVKLTAYDIAGREVKTLINGTYPAGKHSIDFDAENLSSGIYFYKLETGEFTAIRKMVLIK